MTVLITGAAGFLGRKLALRLIENGNLTATNGSPATVDRLVLLSRSRPDVDASNAGIDVEIVAGDITNAAQVREVIESGVDSVFHLAAVVSGEAEADFDLGMRVAVYGGENIVEDRTPLTPLSSYGAEKVISEYLVRDYARKGFLDGRSLRLPTIVVRPGKPNKAASSFASGIIREPLTGKEAVCPVSPKTAITVLSPRRCIEAIVRGHELPADRLGTERSIQLPAIGTTAGEMVEALRAIAGEAVAERVVWRPDPVIEKIVATWPQQIRAQRTRELGFAADKSVNEIIEAFIEDELDGKIA
jgi:nucleoside-diphosphate-sugar epimerase